MIYIHIYVKTNTYEFKNSVTLFMQCTSSKYVLKYIGTAVSRSSAVICTYQCKCCKFHA